MKASKKRIKELEKEIGEELDSMDVKIGNDTYEKVTINIPNTMTQKAVDAVFNQLAKRPIPYQPSKEIAERLNEKSELTKFEEYLANGTPPTAEGKPVKWGDIIASETKYRKNNGLFITMDVKTDNRTVKNVLRIRETVQTKDSHGLLTYERMKPLLPKERVQRGNVLTEVKSTRV